MTTIKYGHTKVVFTSDVQGPMYKPTLTAILAEQPTLAIVGGPPTYLAGFGVKEEHIQQGMQNLRNLVEEVPTTVLSHHLLRDEKWEELLFPIVDLASKTGHTVFTAAEFAGQANNLLEFRRKTLFHDEPPSPEFQKWMKLPRPKRKLVKPPINRDHT